MIYDIDINSANDDKNSEENKFSYTRTNFDRIEAKEVKIRSSLS